MKFGIQEELSLSFLNTKLCSLPVPTSGTRPLLETLVIELVSFLYLLKDKHLIISHAIDFLIQTHYIIMQLNLQ